MQLLTPKAVDRYATALDFEASTLVRSFYRESEKGRLGVDPSKYAGRYAFNNMLTVSFGARTDSATDPLVEKAVGLTMEFMELTVDTFDYAVPRTNSTQIPNGRLRGMYLEVKARIDGGEVVPKFKPAHVKNWIESLDGTNGRMPRTGIVYRTSELLSKKSSVYMHPHGWERRTVPRKTTSIMEVLNCFTLHHEERYPDSYTFNPDRYLNGQLSCAESARLGNAIHWTFGAGRRIFPDLAVAERELWLAVSWILWSFTVTAIPTKPILLEEYEGRSGKEIEPRFSCSTFSPQLPKKEDHSKLCASTAVLELYSFWGSSLDARRQCEAVIHFLSRQCAAALIRSIST
ncbi:hypothetical protein C8R43DRAFT_950208 [Mycena crocata]|nr:hypothetical protein C8R43DRAFT_950208 [Mycena crocata]